MKEDLRCRSVAECLGRQGACIVGYATFGARAACASSERRGRGRGGGGCRALLKNLLVPPRSRL